jgi:hypothetical protein
MNFNVVFTFLSLFFQRLLLEFCATTLHDLWRMKKSLEILYNLNVLLFKFTVLVPKESRICVC